MNTTTNDILYEETIQSLEELYTMHDIEFTHNQWDSSVETEEEEDAEAIKNCQECIVTIFGAAVLGILFRVLLNQMQPLLEPYDG